jgi:hypothetical protein
MSMLINTPICDPALQTDLGNAYDAHILAHRGNPSLALGYPDTDWLNVIRHRASHASDPELKSLTDQMLGMLANPVGTATFEKEFNDIYEKSRTRAYPVAATLLGQSRSLAALTRDYTLLSFDLGLVRRMEDEALCDAVMREFVNEMAHHLALTETHPSYRVYPAVFEIYSEASVYRMLKERAGDRLTISKITEGSDPAPDFECALRIDDAAGESRTLTFYIEVKALDIVDAPQRLPEMLDEGLDVQIDIERQQREGKRVAIGIGEIAPYRRFGTSPGYDPRSPRLVIETLIDKAARNFKATQFKRGPTFALANILRLPLPGQGVNALAPFFYDPTMGGACVSGVLWQFAFGERDSPMHRVPDFEGGGTLDGNLQRAGILIDPALGLPATALLVLHEDDHRYRIDGLYDARFESKAWDWSNIETEEVLHVLCDASNDRSNSMAHEYAKRSS